MRQGQSVENGGMMPVRIPVIPAMRPFIAISRIEAIPISTPPASDTHGVNSVSIMVFLLIDAGLSQAANYALLLHIYKRISIFKGPNVSKLRHHPGRTGTATLPTVLAAAALRLGSDFGARLLANIGMQGLAQNVIIGADDVTA